MALSKRLQSEVRLLYNKQIKPGFWRMGLEAAQLSKAALPGQFINVKISAGCEPLLRRPFSIHQVDGSKVEILYEVVGEATQILSQKKSGEYLDVIGPLGNGFDYSSFVVRRSSPPGRLRFASHSSVVLIAGGMGVAPLLFLTETLLCRPSSAVRREILVLIGAKTKNDILCEQEFKKLGCEVKIATDDGSRGFKGKVTDLLKSILRTTNDPSIALGASERRTTIYSCGPRPMLREISRISEKYNIPAQISLEEHMSCGIGACMGCVVKTKDGYKRVCKDGPVFGANQIVWEG